MSRPSNFWKTFHLNNLFKKIGVLDLNCVTDHLMVRKLLDRDVLEVVNAVVVEHTREALIDYISV